MNNFSSNRQVILANYFSGIEMFYDNILDDLIIKGNKAYFTPEFIDWVELTFKYRVKLAFEPSFVNGYPCLEVEEISRYYTEHPNLMTTHNFKEDDSGMFWTPASGRYNKNNFVKYIYNITVVKVYK